MADRLSRCASSRSSSGEAATARCIGAAPTAPRRSARPATGDGSRLDAPSPLEQGRAVLDDGDGRSSSGWSPAGADARVRDRASESVRAYAVAGDRAGGAEGVEGPGVAWELAGAAGSRAIRTIWAVPRRATCSLLVARPRPRAPPTTRRR